jgi:hypothetical protein
MPVIDETKPYCTYETIHGPTGCFRYRGKGRTDLVLAKKYKGSGSHFLAALQHPDFGWETWETRILETFDTEAEAYEAEAALITLDQLRHPGELNLQAGGKNARGQNRTKLLRDLARSEKETIQHLARVKREAREVQTKKKLEALRQKLKS